jgi:hypothetical protein
MREARVPDGRSVLAGPGSALRVIAPAPLRPLAAAMLEEVAGRSGGRSVALPGADWLVLPPGASPARVGALLGDLPGVAVSGATLPDEAAGALFHADAAPADDAAPGLRHRVLLRGGRPGLQLLDVALPEDGDAARREEGARGLLAALGGAGPLPRLVPGLRLALDMPRERLVADAGGAGLGEDAPIAVFSWEVAAEAGFADRAARFRSGGWALALRVPAPALSWVDVAGLPLDALLCEGATALPRAPHPPLILPGVLTAPLRAEAEGRGWWTEA